MDRFILVTGASSGIGFQACTALLAQGYRVLAGVRTTADAERLQARFGSSLHPILLDVTRDDQVVKAREDAEKIIGHGSLVAIINNAGIVVSGAVLYIPVAEWQRQFDINLMGVIRTTQQFFPLLIQRRHRDDPHPRRIINISSISGLFASPFVGPYCASKYALEAMSDSLRRELYMYDVQVVLIEPGNFRTPIWNKAREETSWFGPEYESILAYKDRILDRSIATGLDPRRLDPVILGAVRNRKVRPRYLVRADAWKFRLILMLPAAWIDRMVKKRLSTRSGIRPF